MTVTFRNSGVALGPDLMRRRAGWADVMSGFVPGFASLEEVLCRAAEAVRGGRPCTVLDLGGGPGLFAERMAQRWPDAEVTLLDHDPVLLALAAAALPPTVRMLAADLATGAWPEVTGGDHDLISVVMTAHYLPAEQVRELYADAHRALAPGGVLVVADLIPDDGVGSLMDALDPAEGEAAAELAWAQWWSELREVAALGSAFLARQALLAARPASAEFTADVSWHVGTARAAGFSQAGTVWRCGRYAALAAIA